MCRLCPTRGYNVDFRPVFLRLRLQFATLQSRPIALVDRIARTRVRLVSLPVRSLFRVCELEAYNRTHVRQCLP